MAPEQLQAEWREFGPWTDLYSLGCLAWSVATGKPPFHEGSWLDIMQAHVTLPPPAFSPRHPVPEDFEAWLRHLLAKSPHQRFRRAADAAWALLALGEPSTDIQSAHGPHPDLAEPHDTLDLLRGAHTTLFWSDEELPDAIALMALAQAPVEARKPFECPPLPQSAHRSAHNSNTLLSGAGLGLYGLRTIPIVGRREEQDELWRALAEVHEHKKQKLVHIGGPVGCGKSRLARWLCQRAHEVGAATILKATHAPFSGPSHGIARMVASHLRCVSLDREKTAERVRLALRAHGVDDDYEWRALTELVAPSEQDPAIRLGSPIQRYILIQRLLARLCRERPVILWFEDVQWGPDALGLARHLQGLSIALPVLILLTSREGTVSASPTLMTELIEGPETTQLATSHLTPKDARELVRGLLGLEGELAERVEERVSGNPLFAVQLVGDWVNRGLLHATEDGFRLQPDARIDLPDDLHALWSDALEPVLSQHPDGAIVALELAAALGDRVDQREWTALCVNAGAPDPSTLTDSLARARLMRPNNNGWTFTHAMLRESLERNAREAGRWVSHNRHCCQVIQGLQPAANYADAGRMGRHLMESGALDEAIALLLVGARKRGETSDYRAALELLDRRDEAAERMGLADNNPERITGWLLRSRIYLLQGRPHLAHAWAERSSAAADAVTQPTLKAAAYCRLGQVAQKQGELDLAERRLLAALPLVRAHQRWEVVGECLFGLGSIADSRGRYARAREIFEDARSAYARVDAPLSVARCLDGMSQSARQMGDLKRARQLNREALSRFQALGNLNGVASSKKRLARLALLERRYRESDTLTREALRLFEHTGDLAGQQQCLNALAESARFQGRLGEAEEGYREALAIGKQIGAGTQLLQATNLALVVLARARYAEARTLLQALEIEIEAAGRRALLAGCQLGLAACAAAMDDVDSTQAHFQRARTLLDETGAVDPDNARSAESAANQLWAHDHPIWARALWEMALQQWKGLGRDTDEERIRQTLRSNYP